MSSRLHENPNGHSVSHKNLNGFVQCLKQGRRGTLAAATGSKCPTYPILNYFECLPTVLVRVVVNLKKIAATDIYF